MQNSKQTTNTICNLGTNSNILFRVFLLISKIKVNELISEFSSSTKLFISVA